MCRKRLDRRNVGLQKQHHNDRRSALLAVNRAKSRTIEQLTQRLTDANEIVAASRVLQGELATTREALRVRSCCVVLLLVIIVLRRSLARVCQLSQVETAQQRAIVARQSQQIERLEARDVGIPTHIWHGERSVLVARTRAAGASLGFAIPRTEKRRLRRCRFCVVFCGRQSN